MSGSPVFLWAGRLHPVKDPLTALHGFARIQAVWPEAQLYLTYLTDELLPEMRRFLRAHPAVEGHVHFWGRVPHREMEAIFNSADFLLQASRREYSGYAVLEAMACGVIPVVTEIPSFQRMTDNGQYGILIAPGDDAALAQRVLALDRETIAACAGAVQGRFEQEFSYGAMASRLLAIYEQAMSDRERPP
jgi:glycosyltransferase involved in cell wall biosynthesis